MICGDSLVQFLNDGRQRIALGLHIAGRRDYDSYYLRLLLQAHENL
jgi:hypothetical protein